GGAMMTLHDCSDIAAHMGEYVDQRLAGDEVLAFNDHIASCRACRQRLNHVRAMQSVMTAVFGDAGPDDEQKEKTGQFLSAVTSDSMSAYAEAGLCAENGDLTPTLFERLGAAPWWFVSFSLHILIIALAGVISMSIELPRSDDAVVMMTELQPRAALKN